MLDFLPAFLQNPDPVILALGLGILCAVAVILLVLMNALTGFFRFVQRYFRRARFAHRRRARRLVRMPGAPGVAAWRRRAALYPRHHLRQRRRHQFLPLLALLTGEALISIPGR